MDPSSGYEALVQTHSGRLQRLCQLLLADGQEAEEVVQEVFVKAFSDWHVFHRRSQLLAARSELGETRVIRLGSSWLEGNPEGDRLNVGYLHLMFSFLSSFPRHLEN